jgi:hypothetical protein
VEMPAPLASWFGGASMAAADRRSWPESNHTAVGRELHTSQTSARTPFGPDATEVPGRRKSRLRDRAKVAQRASRAGAKIEERSAGTHHINI